MKQLQIHFYEWILKQRYIERHHQKHDDDDDDDDDERGDDCAEHTSLSLLCLLRVLREQSLLVYRDYYISFTFLPMFEYNIVTINRNFGEFPYLHLYKLITSQVSP